MITLATAPVVRFESLDSTSAEATRRLAQGERGPLWITAQQQTAGYGRSGRSWSTPKGNLATTLVFQPSCPVGASHQLALVTGVAVHAGLSHIFKDSNVQGPSPQLKWPNDVLIDGRKIVGILIESTTYDGTPVVCIGIGVNVGANPVITQSRATTSLSDLGVDVSPEDVRLSIARALDDTVATWAGGAGFDVIRARWLKRAIPIGAPFSVHVGESTVHGQFHGLDDDGALLLSNHSGDIQRFAYGDVTLGWHPETKETE
ncbi:MAG: biotin--[acetyl-CoA-carboxylase] ligase [Pseudomonadota bacterium]